LPIGVASGYDDPDLLRRFAHDRHITFMRKPYTQQISKERCRLCRTGEGFIVSSYQKKFIATLMPHERSLLRVGAASTISTLVDSLDRNHVSLTREIPP
jgi:hypothetical protein